MRTLAIRFWICAALLAAAVAVAAHAGISLNADEQSLPAKVTIDNFSFTPKEMTVSKGTQVTWINQDDVPHTVVATNKAFRSKALDTDDQFSFTFTEVGTYDYFCSVHPMMTGKVIVK